MSPTKRILYQAFLWLALALSLFVLVRFAGPLLIKTKFWEGDYVLYWSTGRLNWLRENPYSMERNLQLEKENGLIDPAVTEIAIMRYPPWVMPLITFFGIFDYPTSRLLWLLFCTGCLLFSFDISWKLCQGDPRRRWLAMLIGFTFVPVLFALGRGQISALLLLSVALFIKYSQDTRHHLAAGAALVIASVKFHALLLFFLAIGLWVIKNRHWKIALGSLAAVLALLAMVLPINPNILWQYLTTPEAIPYTNFATPAIGTLLRVLFAPDQVWLQFLPTSIGVAWLIGYWLKRSSDWNWLRAAPLLLTASYVAAPFAWTYDQAALALIGIQLGSALLQQKPGRREMAAVVGYIFINLFTLFAHRIYDDFWFFWLAPAWLVFYLLARRLRGFRQYEQKIL